MRAGDAIIVAGKGAETVQITNSGAIPWNDRIEIESILTKIDEQNLT